MLQASITESKRNRELDRKIFRILSELVRYIIFIYLILLMAYARRSKFVYYNNRFVKTHGMTSANAADSVTTPPDVYDYLEDVIENGLYAVDVTNDNIKGFFNEERAFFLQEPRLRQFRMKPKSCKAPKVARDTVRCVQKLGHGDSRSGSLETGSFGEAWSEHVTPLNMTEWSYNFDDLFADYRGNSLKPQLSWA